MKLRESNRPRRTDCGDFLAAFYNVPPRNQGAFRVRICGHEVIGMFDQDQVESYHLQDLLSMVKLLWLLGYTQMYVKYS